MYGPHKVNYETVFGLGNTAADFGRKLLKHFISYVKTFTSKLFDIFTCLEVDFGQIDRNLDIIAKFPSTRRFANICKIMNYLIWPVEPLVEFLTGAYRFYYIFT